MSTHAATPRWLPPWAVEVLVAVFVTLPIGPIAMGAGGGGGALSIWLSLVPACYLWLRHRAPTIVLAVTVVLLVVGLLAADFTPSIMLALIIAMYGYSVSATRARALTVALIVAGVSLPPAIIAAGQSSLLQPLPMLVLAVVAFATAMGDSVRNRRAYIAEITARAVHAEATRESEAARRVSEERLRIARDLHDVVAHQIAVISLNASLASSSVRSDPDEADEALSSIRSAVRQVLSDIGGLLTMLRSDDEPEVAPQPGLNQLPDLVDSFVRSGLEVSLRYEGERVALPPAADVVAARILQEGLTNAHKHGSEGRAHVLITHHPDRLTMLITNPVAPTKASAAVSGGNGLRGIRERAGSVHGEVTSGERGGVFRLSVELPLQQTAGRAAL